MLIVGFRQKTHGVYAGNCLGFILSFISILPLNCSRLESKGDKSVFGLWLFNSIRRLSTGSLQIPSKSKYGSKSCPCAWQFPQLF